MGRLIESATTIQAAGVPPEQIEEFVGRVNKQDRGCEYYTHAEPQWMERTGSGWSIR